MFKLSDNVKKINLINRRMFILSAAKVLIFSGIISRLFYLQVKENKKYLTLSDKNRIREWKLSPVRGEFLDYYDNIIAGNLEVYQLHIVPEEVENIRYVIYRIKDLLELSDREFKKILKKKNEIKPWETLIVSDNLDWKKFSKINNHLYDLNGVKPVISISRNYPFKENFTHVLGYVSQANKDDILNNEKIKEKFVPGLKVGKIGLENIHAHIGSLTVTKSQSNEPATSLTIIGRPNAGKSTLFNSLLNNERSTVSDVPGTTRDKIKENLNLNNRNYSIVDTAGVPRKKQKDQIDRYSSQIAINSLENAHIALIVVDSTEGISFEDKRILKEAIEENVTPVLILNKWDKLNTEQKESINSSVKKDLKQYKWISLIRISALSRKNINLISKQLDLIEQQLSTRIKTSELNTHFRSLWTKTPPHPFRGKRAKLKYVTQYSTHPPEFAFTLSGRIPKNYEAFIENYVRDIFKMNLIAFRIKVNA